MKLCYQMGTGIIPVNDRDSIKDRDTIFCLKGPLENRAMSEVSLNLEGGPLEKFDARLLKLA